MIALSWKLCGSQLRNVSLGQMQFVQIKFCQLVAKRIISRFLRWSQADENRKRQYGVIYGNVLIIHVVGMALIRFTSDKNECVEPKTLAESDIIARTSPIERGLMWRFHHPRSLIQDNWDTINSQLQFFEGLCW